VSTTIRFHEVRAEAIILGVMQNNKMPVNLIQPALREVIAQLYQNGIFLAGDIRYPAVQQLAPEALAAAQQARPAQQQAPRPAPQQPQYAPAQAPTYAAPSYQPPTHYAPQPAQAPMPPMAQPFMVPGMQPAGVGFPPPPQGFAPPPPPGQAAPPNSPVLGPGGVMVMPAPSPIQPVDWSQHAAQAAPGTAGVVSTPPHMVPVNAPVMPENALFPGVAAARGLGPPPAPTMPSPNVVPGPFPVMAP
jgi:hypothetical protein